MEYYCTACICMSQVGYNNNYCRFNYSALFYAFMHADRDQQLFVITLIASCAAGGTLLCLLIVVCTFCTCIVKLGKRRRAEEFDLGVREAEPVYETIVDPAYAQPGMCDIQKETELMFNNAYNYCGKM